MSTPVVFPKINDWKIFEDFCLDLWSEIWGVKGNLYGRQGQEQHGIDILFNCREEGFKGIQCKNVQKLNENNIDEEIDKAKNLPNDLSVLIFATTLNRDKKLQSYVLNKSMENLENGLFEVNIVFWEDLCKELLNYIDLTKKYFPNFFHEDKTVSLILDDSINYLDKCDFNNAFEVINLFKDSFNHLSNENKYKYLILNGEYHLLCNNIKESSLNFYESYSYSSKDLKSKYYKALGLLLKQDYKNSKLYIQDILDEDPFNENAHSLLIWVEKISFEDILLNIPDELKDSDKINYSLGCFTFKNKDYENAEIFFKKANDLSINPKIRLDYGIFLLNRFYDKYEPYYINQYNSDLFNELKVIETIFKNELYQFSNNLLKENINWLINLTNINLMLKNIEDLNSNLNKALSLDSKNHKLLFNKSQYLCYINKKNEALIILKDLLFVHPFYFKYFSTILFKDNEYDEVVKYGEMLLLNLDEDSEDLISINLIIIEAYLAQGKKKEAKNIITSFKKNNKFYYNLYFSQLCEDNNKTKEYLLLSKNYMEHVEISDKFILAVHLSKIGCFDIAIEIYEKNLNLTFYSNLLMNLIHCYYDNGDYNKALDLINMFISREQYVPDMLKVAMNIYSQILDLSKLKELSHIYLNNFELDPEIKFNLVKIDWAEKNYDDVDEFLNEKHDFKELGLLNSRFLYYLYKKRNFDQKILLSVLFDIRDIFKHDVDAHLFYVFEFLRNDFDLDNVDVVDWDMAIQVEYPNKTVWKFLTKDKINPFSGLINENTPLNKFIGCRVGDSIDLGFNKVKLLDIKDKYFYAYIKSRNLLSTSADGKFQDIYLGEGEDRVDKLFEILEKQSNSDYFAEFYNNHSIPIFFVSKFSKMDFISSYLSLMRKGLKSFNPKYDWYYIENQTLVLDLSALVTIHLLGIEDIVKNSYNLVTSYNTLFLLEDLCDNNTPISNIIFPSLKLINLNSNFTPQDLFDWVKNNCSCVPTTSWIHINKNQRDLIKKLDEPYVIDNIVLAIENRVLLSDDVILKNLSRKFGVKSTSTLNIIKDCFIRNIIDEEHYLKLINILFLNNFQYVGLSSKNLMLGISNNDLSVLFKVINNMDLFNDNLVNMLTNFIFDLFNSNVDKINCFIIVKILFDSLISRKKLDLLILITNEICKRLCV